MWARIVNPRYRHVLGREKYDEWNNYIPVGDREDDGLGMDSDRSDSSRGLGGDNSNNGDGDPPSLWEIFKNAFLTLPKNEAELEETIADRDLINGLISETKKGFGLLNEYLFNLMTSPLPVGGGKIKVVEKGFVFFSGKGTEAFALKQGYKTLGQTKAGINLDKLIKSKNIPWDGAGNAKDMWSRLSAAYAKSVPNGSTVRVFLNNPDVASIWLRTEYPILRDKGVKIIYTHLKP